MFTFEYAVEALMSFQSMVFENCCYFLQIIVPEETLIHEEWNGNVEDGNDIALLRLGVQSKHTPVKLPPSILVMPRGAKLLALGWGSQGNQKSSSILQQATNIQIVNNDVCKADGVWGDIIKESMTCAFGFKGEDVCGGNGSILAMLLLLFTIYSVGRFAVCCCRYFSYKLGTMSDTS